MASSLASTFRLLYSKDVSLDRKLEAAEELAAALLPGLPQPAAGRAADSHVLAALPPLVRAHYLRSLLDWSCGSLTKKGAHPAAAEDGAQKGKKRKQQEEKGAALHKGSDTALMSSLQPRCWTVLTAVLGSSGTAASQQLPVTLLPAATAVLNALREGGQQQLAGGDSGLLDQLAELLRLLHGKFSSSFRPGIEHATAAAEAALLGHAAAGEQEMQLAWEHTAASAVRLLLAAATGHPNQRKVWDATLPRLLPLLAQAAFPASPSQPGDKQAGGTELSTCCLDLLRCMIFCHQHVAALAAAAAPEMAAAVAAAGAVDAPAPGSAAVEDAADGQPPLPQLPQQQQHGGTYAAQLFALLREQVAGGQLPLELLPWMVSQFCTALRVYRQTVETEAAITSQAGIRSQQQQQQQQQASEEAGGEDGGGGASTTQPSRQVAATPAAAAGISVSADFHFWLAMLRTLLPHVQQLQGEAAADAQLAEAASGLAMVAAVLQPCQLYRPTQDPAHHQRLLLQQLADAALALAQRQLGGKQAASLVSAALGVLGSILAVEHRVIQHQLPALWPLLLWLPGTGPPPLGGPGDSSSTVNGAAVAAGVAAGLVQAFAELRQLEVLLSSLTTALQHAPQASEPGCASAAAAVLHSSQFRAALAAAMQQLPSGQVPLVLRLAAAAVPQHLAEGAPTGVQLLALDVYCCCLDSLHVDLTTAVAAAGTAEALVAALAPPLLALLPAAMGASSKMQEEAGTTTDLGSSVLPALLQLYRRALAVHARCAGLHPQVVPLTGQHARLVHSTADGGQGYFAPLRHSAGATIGQAPQLADLLLAAGSGTSLRAALLQAAQHRLLFLEQQRQYLVYCCPVTLLADTNVVQAADGADTAEVALDLLPAEQQGEMRQQVEAELRQLATFVAAGAAEEAAGGGSQRAAACDALEVAVQVLALLADWSEEVPLQALLQEALAGVCKAAVGQQRHHQLARHLLVGCELLEQRRAAELLPAAAAAQLCAAFSAAFGDSTAVAEGTAGQNVEKALAKKKRKSLQSDGAAGSVAAAHLTPLLEQMGRIANGKGVKPKAWSAGVQSSSSAIADLAGAVASSIGSGGGAIKKRKHSVAPAAGSTRLLGAQQQMLLLAQLPLQHLPAEVAATMAAVALGSLLCCCEGSLSLIHAAATADRQQLARQALSAICSCLALLAALATGDGSSGSGVSSQAYLLPGALHVALAAASSLAGTAAAGALEAQHQLGLAAEHCRIVMQAVFSAGLAGDDGSSLQHNVRQLAAQLADSPPTQQWAAGVLVQACVGACCVAAHGIGSTSSSTRAATDILCAPSSDRQLHGGPAAELVGSVAAQLDAAVAAALLPAPAGASLAQLTDGSWLPVLQAANLYRSAALLLRLRCQDHPAAETLQRQQEGSVTCLSTLASSLQVAAALLMQQQAAGSLLAPALLEYVAAACALTGRMRPAASSRHYASLLALLLHLLTAEHLAGAAEASRIPPSRHTIPFSAAFPATAATAGLDKSAGGSSSSGLRLLVLEALQELVAGSSSQHLLLPLRFAEAALPAAGSHASSTLPLCELLLAVLEAGSTGNRQQRLLGQHGERIAAVLTGFVTSTAYGGNLAQHAGRQQQVPSLPQLAAAILAAGEGSAGASITSAAAGAAGPASPTPGSGHASLQVDEAAGPTVAEVAALCTSLRALESLAARPRLFPLTPAAAGSMLSSITALWTAYAEQGESWGLAAAPARLPLPGFRFRLGTSGGAGLFSASCHLLLTLLRHRQQETKRCVPLMLQAIRALLRFLVAVELSAKLQLQVLPLLPSSQAASQQQAEVKAQQVQRERGWRATCAELLAAVLADVAELKEAGIGRYCPQLLADYLILAVAPPSAKSRALLHFSSPAASAAAAALQPAVGGSGGDGAVAAAAAEEDVLAGEPLSREASAALRQGAFALYSACSGAEIQFLYASLGSTTASQHGRAAGTGTVASWRAALAALKTEYERSGRYSGKV